MTTKAIEAVERKIINAALRSILAAGHNVTVDDGGPPDEWEAVETRSRKVILDATYAVCCAKWVIKYADGSRLGWVYFIRANDGWDVISDYSYNDATEALLKRAFEIADNYS